MLPPLQPPGTDGSHSSRPAATSRSLWRRRRTPSLTDNGCTKEKADAAQSANRRCPARGGTCRGSALAPGPRHLAAATSRPRSPARPFYLMLTAALLWGAAAVALTAIPAALHVMALATLAAIAACWWRQRAEYGRARGLPPGSLRPLDERIWRDPKALSDLALRHGPIFKLQPTLKPYVCVAGFDLARDLLRDHGQSLAALPWPATGEVPGGFLRFLRGDAHRRVRRIVVAAMRADLVGPNERGTARDRPVRPRPLELSGSCGPARRPARYRGGLARPDPVRHRPSGPAPAAAARGFAGTRGSGPHAPDQDLPPRCDGIRHRAAADAAGRGWAAGLRAGANFARGARRCGAGQPVHDAAGRRLRSRQPAALGAPLSGAAPGVARPPARRRAGRAHRPGARLCPGDAAPRPGRGGHAQRHGRHRVRRLDHPQRLGRTHLPARAASRSGAFRAARLLRAGPIPDAVRHRPRPTPRSASAPMPASRASSWWRWPASCWRSWRRAASLLSPATARA